MSDLSDFDRWLIAGGIDPNDIGDDFPSLWASYEAWTRRLGSVGENSSKQKPPANLPDVSTAILLPDERWPARAVRAEVSR